MRLVQEVRELSRVSERLVQKIRGWSIGCEMLVEGVCGAGPGNVRGWSIGCERLVGIVCEAGPGDVKGTSDGPASRQPSDVRLVQGLLEAGLSGMRGWSRACVQIGCGHRNVGERCE